MNSEPLLDLNSDLHGSSLSRSLADWPAITGNCSIDKLLYCVSLHYPWEQKMWLRNELLTHCVDIFGNIWYQLLEVSGLIITKYSKV